MKVLCGIPTISQIEAMDTAKIASVFISELEKHIKVNKKRTVVDKLPLNILDLPLINQVFPEREVYNSS